jgi:hypothetical protein
VIFKEWSYECTACGEKQKHLHWSVDAPPLCACGGRLGPYSVVATRNRGVIDDQIEGGPRFFETMGHEPVWIESKSQWKREVDKRQLVNVVRHDSAYYAKQRKMHDEKLRDERGMR